MTTFEYLRKLNDLLFVAFTFSSQVWMFDKREKMIEYFIDRVFENELCTAVVVSDRTGEYYRMGEDVMFCRYLNYLPKTFNFITSRECQCENVKHSILIMIPILEGSAVYIFLSEESEEVIQILKDMAMVLARAIENLETKETVYAMVKRLERNLEYFQFLADRLRNPLSVIMGVTEMVDEFGVGKGLRMIRESAERMKKVLDDLGDAEVLTKKMCEDNFISEFTR